MPSLWLKWRRRRRYNWIHHALKPVFDPTVASAVQAAITPNSFTYNKKTRSIDGTPAITASPVNIACDVYVRYNGTEQRLNVMTCIAHSSTCQYSTQGNVSSPPPPKIDIILRPSAEAALGTVDMQKYWNQEITFHDVPVTQK